MSNHQQSISPDEDETFLLAIKTVLVSKTI
jgi:hypothetical protein